MKCHTCEEEAVYRCSICGRATCGPHLHLRTLCSTCIKKRRCSYIIREADNRDRGEIGVIVTSFWGDPEQLMFGRTIVVAEEPAFVAESNSEIAGFIAYSELDDDMLIAGLGVRPQYQGCGIGRALISAVEEKARKLGKKRILVSTSNDDLPALAFYQLLGFQIFGVITDVIAEKHGTIQRGIGNIPIRDEIRLQKMIAMD